MVDVLSDLNEQQRRAVIHEGGPLLIVAGAGTGKTTVITRRIVWQLQAGLKPEEVLALTFTDKAAQEMEDRVAQLLPIGFGDLWISTFHAFGERILRAHAIDAGISDDFRLLSPTESWWLLKKHADRFSFDYYRPRGNPTKFFHALLQHFSRAKDEGIGVVAYRAYADDRRLNQDATIAVAEEARVLEIAEGYRIYQEILAEENALDFGDLLLSLRDLFRQRPAILRRYQKQFRAILVDEFQDTNSVQYELVKLLAGGSDPDSLGRSLTVVADDDQAIYRWRGASFNNVIHFMRDVRRATVVVLTENYRSCQSILDVAYRFIQHNNPHRLETAINEATGGGLGRIVKLLTTTRDRPGVVEHLHATTEEAEARAVVERILDLKHSDPSVLWSDIAILVRANSDAVSFLPTLSAADVPYRHFAARGLYKRPFILDLISALRVIDNVFASSSLWRVLTSSLIAIDQRDRSLLIESMRERGDIALFDLLKKIGTDESFSAAGRTELSKLFRWIETLAREARERDIGGVLLRLLEITGMLTVLGKAQDQQTLRNLADLQQFYTIIDRFRAVTDEPTLHAFLEFLDLALASGDEGSPRLDALEGPDAVQVLTVHSAKGLEFRYVFLAHCVDRRFPTGSRADQLEFPHALKNELGSGEGDLHLMEERRLFYVGMTRARDGLFFTSAEDYGGLRKKKLSRFLFEAGIASPQAPPKPTGRTRFDSENPKSQAPNPKQYQNFNIQNSKHERPTSDFRPPTSFSYTQLKAYETCPLQYKFAHVFKLPRRGNWLQSFGKTMHTTLEKFFSLAEEGSQGLLFDSAPSREILPVSRVPALATLLELYERYWIPEWYASHSQAQEYRSRGKAMLLAMYERYEKTGWPSIWALEKPFLLNIGGFRLKGKIDRIDLVDAEAKLPAGSFASVPRPASGGTDVPVVIVDYKTGKSPKTDEDVDRDQLLLYQIAVSTLMRVHPIQLSYYFLEDQKQVSFIGTPEELNVLQGKITQTVGQIRSGAFEARPSKNTCTFCDFKEICEYRVL